MKPDSPKIEHSMLKGRARKLVPVEQLTDIILTTDEKSRSVEAGVDDNIITFTRAGARYWTIQGAPGSQPFQSLGEIKYKKLEFHGNEQQPSHGTWRRSGVRYHEFVEKNPVTTGTIPDPEDPTKKIKVNGLLIACMTAVQCWSGLEKLMGGQDQVNPCDARIENHVISNWARLNEGTHLFLYIEPPHPVYEGQNEGFGTTYIYIKDHQNGKLLLTADITTNGGIIPLSKLFSHEIYPIVRYEIQTNWSVEEDTRLGEEATEGRITVVGFLKED